MAPVRDLLVLCYHAVSERWESELAVTPARLREQLSMLVRRGYRGATLSDAILEPRPDRTVVVTFDDGYRSVLELGLPILSDLGLPASVFVPTSFVGSPEPMSWVGIDHWVDSRDRDELRCLSWDDLGLLIESGWEVGSHTLSHPHLTQLDQATLQHELRGSREQCQEHLGRACDSIAYPFGDTDTRVVEVAAECGYKVGATLPPRPHRPRPLHWPRIGIYRENTNWIFRVKVSRLRRWLGVARNIRSDGLDGGQQAPRVTQGLITRK